MQNYLNLLLECIKKNHHQCNNLKLNNYEAARNHRS